MKQMTFNQLSQSAVYKADDVSVSLTVCGGTYGGGSEVLVVYGFDSYNQAIFAETSQTLKEHGGGRYIPQGACNDLSNSNGNT